MDSFGTASPFTIAVLRKTLILRYYRWWVSVRPATAVKRKYENPLQSHQFCI